MREGIVRGVLKETSEGTSKEMKVPKLLKVASGLIERRRSVAPSDETSLYEFDSHKFTVYQMYRRELNLENFKVIKPRHFASWMKNQGKAYP